MTTLNTEQIDSMKHALKNGNRFFTQADDKDWLDLVEKGLAFKGRSWTKEDAYFYVTDKGKKLISEIVA